LTLGATAFLCFATAGFFATDFRAITFFGARALAATTFFLTAAFFVDFDFTTTFALAVLRALAVFTARFAFGRAAALDAVARLPAADFGVERRAIVRDVERLKPFVTALISKVVIERAMGT
jgi:hypothetical protein